MSMNQLQTAKDLASRGWHVFPVAHPANDTAEQGKRGKRPATPNGLKDATLDADQISRWFGNGRLYNIGIRTGAESGFDVLDIDGVEGEKALRNLIAVYGNLPDTPTVRTGGGGMHYYFRHRDGVRNSTGVIGKNIDVRGDGGYVVAPPSLHESGRAYEWVRHPDTTPLADWPSWLLSRMRKPAVEKPRHDCAQSTNAAEADIITEGQRNATLTSLAGSMRRKGFDTGAIEAALVAHNRTHCRPPMPEAEVRRIAASVARYEPHPATQTKSLLKFERTDFGAGEAFASVADDFLFDGNAGHWLQWDGKRWCRDSSKQARKAFVQRVARAIRDEAVKLQNAERAAAEKYPSREKVYKKSVKWLHSVKCDNVYL